MDEFALHDRALSDAEVRRCGSWRSSTVATSLREMSEQLSQKGSAWQFKESSRKRKHQPPLAEREGYCTNPATSSMMTIHPSFRCKLSGGKTLPVLSVLVADERKRLPDSIVRLAG